jgi:parallel beta-helix repeat protein
MVCLPVFFTFAVALYSTVALGATIYVPADQPTIQAGIDAASPGDVVSVADGIYTGAGNKNLDFNGKAITVQSENGPANCFIDCEGVGRAFGFDNGEGQDSVLSGFTIKNSEVGYDAIVCSNSSSPTLTNCIITDNGGSGIFCGDNSSPTITNCTISNNTADYGGGLHCNNASATISDSVITGNANNTGTIHCAENCSLTITNCSVTDNTGGGITCYDSPSLTITTCSITDNTGRGINCYNSSSITISDSMIARNSQRGIQIENSSSASITNCTITENITEWGGAGIEIVNSSPTVTNCIISNNTATLNGAGIRCRENSSPTITNCTIGNNTASGNGGGIHMQDNSSPTVTNSILWADSPDEISIDTGALGITYSDIEDGWPGEGNISADPLFVGGGDYHLTGMSPCINAGTSAGAPDGDIDGDPRPQQGGYDIGADEYVIQAPIYDATGTWTYSITNNWADAPCPPEEDETGTATITQADHNVTIVDDDGLIWTGTVDGADYLLSTSWPENGGTVTATLNFTLTSVTSGAGTMTWYWTDGIYWCNGGADLSITRSLVLSVTIPSAATEGDGILLGQGTVGISQTIGAVLEVSLVSSDTTELTVPPTVTIPQGDTTATFDLTVVDDLEVDDTQTVSVTASAAGWTSAGDTIAVQDNDDSDNDGMADWWEMDYFGNLDRDGSEDFDGDELADLEEYLNSTDPTDPDSDADTMPDGWEVTYGLDPLVNDASGDLDGDGVSNVDEYNAGRHPNNWEPDTPVLSFPSDGEMDVELTPTLSTAAFSDSDGDNHAQTEWQISSSADFSDTSAHVMSVDSTLALTSFMVPDYILGVGNTYYWRTRFLDDRDAASEWSDPFSFSTLAEDESDLDGDGVPDNQEIDDPDLDLDGDGNPDIAQGDIKCVNTVVGDTQIGIKGTTPSVTSVDAVKSVDPATITDTQNKPDEMPLGLVCFKVTVANPGDSAEVTVYLSEPAPAGAKWYKYDSINGWRVYPYATFSADRMQVTLELEDGSMEYGDTDGLANSFIVDPSGAGVAAAPAAGDGGGGGGGGGGCFIATASYGSSTEPYVKTFRELSVSYRKIWLRLLTF